MDGNKMLAPSCRSTLSGSGPVFNAMVKIPAATPALTPNGAFSMTTASLACMPAFCKAIR